MRKAKVTPIGDDGKKLSPITINLDGISSLRFTFIFGTVYMHAAGLKNAVKLAETPAEIHDMHQLKPREYKVRSTTQIIIEGNNDLKQLN